MRIDNVTINFAAQPALGSALLAAIMNKATATAADKSADASTPPRIGDAWAEQGGVYAGIARGVDGGPDMHLVLASEEPADKLTWKDAMAWADGLDHEGFSDWALPTRFDSALLYANLRESFDPSPWYWTSTQFSGAGYAWYQYFCYGTQDYRDKSYEGRVRAVRRFAA